MKRKDAFEKTSNVFCFKLPRELVYQIDAIVSSGRYLTRAEFVRKAILLLIENEMSVGSKDINISKLKKSRKVKVINISDK